MYLRSYILENKEKGLAKYLILAIPELFEAQPLWLGVIEENGTCAWFNVDRIPTKYPTIRHMNRYFEEYGIPKITVEDYIDSWGTHCGASKHHYRCVELHILQSDHDDGWSIDWWNKKVPHAEAISVPGYEGIFNIETQNEIRVAKNIPRIGSMWRKYSK